MNLKVDQLIDRVTQLLSASKLAAQPLAAPTGGGVLAAGNALGRARWRRFASGGIRMGDEGYRAQRTDQAQYAEFV